MAILKQIAKKTEINGERDNARKNGTLPPEEPGTFNFGGIFFKLSEQQGKLTECNKFDLQRIIDSIKEAKKCADYVIVMVTLIKSSIPIIQNQIIFLKNYVENVLMRELVVS